MTERFVTETIHDKTLDVSLRPSVFADFTGQRKVKERLELAVEAARQRKESLDHILLSGPPGLGKTTLAYILAKAMNVNVVATSGPVIEKAGDLAGLLTKLNEGDVLFIDEIHRLKTRWRNISIPRWRISGSTSSSIKDRTPAVCG